MLKRIFIGAYNRGLLQSYEGINLCDLATTDAAEYELHRLCFVQALKLVKQNDPRRFHRIQKELAYIVSVRGLACGSYDSLTNACHVDLSQLDFAGDRHRSVIQLACLLVHEATHGEIKARGIKYSRQNFLRVERLCHQEEQRFLSRVAPKAAEEFDGSAWQDYWRMNTFQRVVKFYRQSRARNKTT